MKIDLLNSRAFKIITWAGCAAFLIGLGSFAYSGLFSRYMADDYCTPLYTRYHGLWDGQIAAYQIATGRFASTFFISLFEYLGPFTYRLMPALVIILWTAGMAWFFLSIRRYLPFRIPAAAAWLLGMVVVFSTIAGAPSRLQSLYWRDGMFNYGSPMVVFPYLLVVFALELGQKRPVWRLILSCLGCAVLALTAGGMSETFIALEVAIFLVCALFALLIWRGWLRCQALVMLASSLGGALVALVITWLAPSTHSRQAYFPPPPDLVTLVKLSLLYGYYFMRTSTNLIKLLSFMTIGIPAVVMFFLSPKGLPGKWWHWLVALVLWVATGYAFLVAACAPSVYGESSFPEQRVLMIARFSLVCTMVIAGGTAGMALRRWLDGFPRLLPAGRWLNFAALCVLVLFCVYSLRVSWKINVKELPARQAWAAAWDIRDVELRAAAARGETVVHVVALDSWETVYELTADPGLWVNACAAQFYGLKQIIATPP